MGGTVKQIIGSFEDIGKDVVREAVRVPGDVAGKALESLGSSSGKKQSSSKTQTPSGDGKKDTSAFDEIDGKKDQDAKKAVARAALQALVGEKKKQKEPTPWERLQEENAKRKRMEEKKNEAAKKDLPLVSTKRRRGDLYGIKGKTGSEVGKNVRQD